MGAWFLHYHRLAYDLVSGMDVFTLLDKMPSHKRENILSRLHLNKDELPVFVLTISEDEYIINTTYRFIRLQGLVMASINYGDFEYHAGYKSMYAGSICKSQPLNIKKDGYFDEFGLRLKTGEIIYWKIPTGRPGFGFWNVTKRCGLD